MDEYLIEIHRDGRVIVTVTELSGGKTCTELTDWMLQLPGVKLENRVAISDGGGNRVADVV